MKKAISWSPLGLGSPFIPCSPFDLGSPGSSTYTGISLISNCDAHYFGTLSSGSPLGPDTPGVPWSPLSPGGPMGPGVPSLQ